MLFIKKPYIKNIILYLSSLFVIISSIAIVTTASLGLAPHKLPPPWNAVEFIKNELNSNEYTEVLQSPRSYNDGINNALLTDAKQKANTNSVLVYYIGWVAVFHKFGFISHLLSVIDINPSKEIYIYVDRNTFNFDFLKTYKNIAINYINTEWPTIDNISTESLLSLDFLNRIDDLSKTYAVDLYITDVMLFENIQVIMDTSKLELNIINSVINQFSDILYKT